MYRRVPHHAARADLRGEGGAVVGAAGTPGCHARATAARHAHRRCGQGVGGWPAAARCPRATAPHLLLARLKLRLDEHHQLAVGPQHVTHLQGAAGREVRTRGTEGREGGRWSRRDGSAPLCPAVLPHHRPPNRAAATPHRSHTAVPHRTTRYRTVSSTLATEMKERSRVTRSTAAPPMSGSLSARRLVRSITRTRGSVRTCSATWWRGGRGERQGQRRAGAQRRQEAQGRSWRGAARQ